MCVGDVYMYEIRYMFDQRELPVPPEGLERVGAVLYYLETFGLELPVKLDGRLLDIARNTANIGDLIDRLIATIENPPSTTSPEDPSYATLAQIELASVLATQLNPDPMVVPEVMGGREWETFGQEISRYQADWAQIPVSQDVS